MVGRDALLDAAWEALAQAGPDLPASDVARRAGTSKALVFHHFGSREGLLDAMAARVLAQTQEGLTRLAEDYPHPLERVEALCRALLAPPAEPPREARHVLLFWLQGERGRLRDDLLVDFVRQTLREGAATGSTARGADPDALAGMLLARWHGATLLYATGRPVEWEREARSALAEVAALAASR